MPISYQQLFSEFFNRWIQTNLIWRRWWWSNISWKDFEIKSHTITVPFKFHSSMHHRISPKPTCRMNQETRDTLHLVDSIVDEILSRDNIIEIAKPVAEAREWNPIIHSAMLAIKLGMSSVEMWSMHPFWVRQQSGREFYHRVEGGVFGFKAFIMTTIWIHQNIIQSSFWSHPSGPNINLHLWYTNEDFLNPEWITSNKICKYFLSFSLHFKQRSFTKTK